MMIMGRRQRGEVLLFPISLLCSFLYSFLCVCSCRFLLTFRKKWETKFDHMLFLKAVQISTVVSFSVFGACLSVTWPCCLVVKNHTVFSNSFRMWLPPKPELRNQRWSLSHPSAWGCEIREVPSLLALPQRKIQYKPLPHLDFSVMFVMSYSLNERMCLLYLLCTM